MVIINIRTHLRLNPPYSIGNTMVYQSTLIFDGWNTIHHGFRLRFSLFPTCMRFSCCKCRRIRSSRKVRWREDFGSKITGKWRFETPGTSWRFETSWGSPKSSSRHGWPWLSMETHGDDWGSPIWRNSHMRSEPSWRAHHRSTWTLNNNRSVTKHGWLGNPRTKWSF